MDNKSEVIEMELVCVIVNTGMGSKILKTSKKHGVSGGTIVLGRGTANYRIWDFLGLSEVEKEIVYMVTEKTTAYHVLDILNHEFKFCKPNHGIAFTTSIGTTVGLSKSNFASENVTIERGENEKMYQVITTIVEKGKAEDVIEAAISAGSKGGTIVNGRGSGIHETSRLFNMEIEPEKEVVIILSEAEKTESIVSVIREKMHIDEPGKGIIYVQDVNRTYGIYQEK